MRIPNNFFDKYCQGATAKIHLTQTHDNHADGLIEVIKNINDVDVKEDARRSWSRKINIIQKLEISSNLSTTCNMVESIGNGGNKSNPMQCYSMFYRPYLVYL